MKYFYAFINSLPKSIRVHIPSLFSYLESVALMVYRIDIHHLETQKIRTILFVQVDTEIIDKFTLSKKLDIMFPELYEAWNRENRVYDDNDFNSPIYTFDTTDTEIWRALESSGSVLFQKYNGEGQLL